jgi:hypothetical protein
MITLHSRKAVVSNRRRNFDDLHLSADWSLTQSRHAVFRTRVTQTLRARQSTAGSPVNCPEEFARA